MSTHHLLKDETHFVKTELIHLKTCWWLSTGRRVEALVWAGGLLPVPPHELQNRGPSLAKNINEAIEEPLPTVEG